MIDVAHDWGVIPSQLGLCKPEDDLSVMAAFTWTTAKMRAHEQEEQERKLEEMEQRAGHKGRVR